MDMAARARSVVRRIARTVRLAAVRPLLLVACAGLLAAAVPAAAQTPFDASKAFAPASIRSGGTSTLQITLNSNFRGVPITAIAFSDTFPAGMTLGSGTAVNQCGGTLALASGSFTFSNGTLAALASCTVNVNVIGTSTRRCHAHQHDVVVHVRRGRRGGNVSAVSGTLFVKGGTPPTITSPPPPTARRVSLTCIRSP